MFLQIKDFGALSGINRSCTSGSEYLDLAPKYELCIFSGQCFLCTPNFKLITQLYFVALVFSWAILHQSVIAFVASLFV